MTYKMNQVSHQVYNIKILTKYRQSSILMNLEQPSDSEFNQPEDDLNKGEFREETLLQYYRYLNLLKRTNNFCKDPKVYKDLSDHDFEDLAIVGWIFQVETLKIKLEDGKEQQCMVPIVYSNIKDPFRNYLDANYSPKPYTTQLNSSYNNCGNKPSQDPNSKQQQVVLEPHIRRPLLVVKNVYAKYFIKAFNQIIKESKEFKKFFVTQNNTNNNGSSSGNSTNGTSNQSNSHIFSEIQWIYAFTGLRMAIEDGRLYFVITEKTKIVALDTKFYLEWIQNLQRSVGFPYSYMTLNSMPKNYDAKTIQQGYSLTNLQTQASIIDKIAFTGILKEKYFDQSQAGSNKKDKEVILTFLEDGIHPSKPTLGIAKVLIKCSYDQNPQDIAIFFKIGYVYLVTNASVLISNTISLLFKPKLKWKENIQEINVQKSAEITSKMIKELPITDMKCLKMANVNRNIVKIQVDLVHCQAFYGKLLCTNCKRPINSDKFCTGYCGQNQGELILWIVALVSDETTYAQISMEKREALAFFDFKVEHLEEMRNFILAQNSRKMVKMYDKFYHEFNHGQWQTSDHMMGFQRHVSMSFVTKRIIGVPRFNLNETFTQQLSEEEKTEFQQSLQTSKEYVKKNKVHFNGYVKRIEKDFKQAVPFIKVLQIVE